MVSLIGTQEQARVVLDSPAAIGRDMGQVFTCAFVAGRWDTGLKHAAVNLAFDSRVIWFSINACKFVDCEELELHAEREGRPCHFGSSSVFVFVGYKCNTAELSVLWITLTGMAADT